MANLIAYIPVLHAGYRDWLLSREGSTLLLIGQGLASSLLPRLARNMPALTTEEIGASILMLGWARIALPFYEVGIMEGWDYILPDEDVSHALYEKYRHLFTGKVKFENTFLRWDMTAVKRQEPVLTDCEVSLRGSDWQVMNAALVAATHSPDWWRQVGAAAFQGEEILSVGYNQHFPTEYETAAYGDPRLNFDAGDPAAAEVYLSLHAERVVIAKCAREGIALAGASLVVTTFPCPDCCRWIAMSGIKEVFFFEGYSMLKGLEPLRAHGIRVVQLKKRPERP